MFKYLLMEWYEKTDRTSAGFLCKLVGCNPIALRSGYAYAGHYKKCGYKKK